MDLAKIAHAALIEASLGIDPENIGIGVLADNDWDGKPRIDIEQEDSVPLMHQLGIGPKSTPLRVEVLHDTRDEAIGLRDTIEPIIIETFLRLKSRGILYIAPASSGENRIRLDDSTRRETNAFIVFNIKHI